MAETRVSAPHILVSAGEVSGDIVGARLAASLRAQAPGIRLSGFGGQRMEAAGVTLVMQANHLGTVGVSEVISAVPQGLRALAAARRHVAQARPDAAVLIGNDIFNAVLGRWLKRRGIPAIALFPPQVWLWQPLVPLFARSFDLVLAAFPEEEERYTRAGARTVFVGHYLADELAPVNDEERMAARRRLGLGEQATVIGVLPGSRAHEVARLLPILGDTIAALHATDPNLQVIVPAADGYSQVVRAWAAAQPGAVIVEARESHDAMRASDMLVCCSGTATLEASLLGVPHVIVYRTSVMTSLTAQACIRVGLLPDDTIGLPNLLLGRGTVQEFKQRRLTSASLLSSVRQLIGNDQARAGARTQLARLRPLVLGPGSVERTTRLVLREAAGS
jgi:lipid-A-disaccharide synthase